jgi:nucleoid-associated protein YgaU
MLFKSRLTKLDFTYSLFKPDGTPLRARAAVTFVGYTDEVELAKQANKTSPDLSHVLTVKGGDTLPLMCYQIYGTSAYYLQVAKVNQLINFRSLVVGSQLLFPPLQSETL